MGVWGGGQVARLGASPPITPADKARGAARWVLYAVGAVLLFTLLRSVFRVFGKYTSATAVRSRTVNKNKVGHGWVKHKCL
jgi:hypothetical protein